MKVVHYQKAAGIQKLPNGSFIVHPIDHTSPLVSNSTHVYTSTVQAHDEETGVFVTQNSLYIPK